jgi:hypothetical protein
MLLHEVLPARSKALTVIVLLPVTRGTVADQLRVPTAMPEAPKFVLQVICAKPIASNAVPAM